MDGPERRAGWRFPAVLAAGLFGLGALSRSSIFSTGGSAPAVALNAAAFDDDTVGMPSNANQADWWMYKVTYPTLANRSGEILTLVNTSLAPVDMHWLGCTGVKMYAVLGDGVGLHWVEAPALSTGADYSLEYIVTYFESLTNATINGGEWNAFMHNRVQMYTKGENFIQMVKNFRAIGEHGLPMMLRKSVGYSGYGQDGTIQVAHVTITIGGRLYEIAAGIYNNTELTHLTESWKIYGDVECEPAMRLSWNDVEELDEYFAFKVSNWAQHSSAMAKWIEERGFAPPVLLDVQVASPAATETVANWLGMSDFLNASSTTVVKSEKCVAERVSIANTNDAFGGIQSTITYVENRLAKAFDDEELPMSVARYASYVETVHETTKADSGYGWGIAWDHFLDQHIGFEYKGTGTCSQDTIDLVQQLDKELKNSDLLVANRQEGLYFSNASGLPRNDDYDDADDNIGQQVSNHFYCGKWGTMTWEYNVAGCEDGIIVETNVCTCIPENSDRIYMDQNPAKKCE